MELHRSQTNIMKLPQDDAKTKRKILKPQVERRRRERMNRSLESLKTLLLQQKEETPRRLQKAEILEKTVLFLQDNAKGDNRGAGGQKHTLQDGFSSCLQRAAQFLGPRGKSLCLGAPLDATFAARVAQSDSEPAGVQWRNIAQPSSSLALRKSSKYMLRMLIHRSKCRQHTPAFHAARSSSTTSQQNHTAASPGSKQSRHQNLPVGQTFWRPWP